MVDRQNTFIIATFEGGSGLIKIWFNVSMPFACIVSCFAMTQI